MEAQDPPLKPDQLQRRAIIEQAARAAVQEFKLDNPELFQQAEEHTPWKNIWTIVCGVLTIGICSTGAWVASSIGEMKETIGRMDERLKGQENLQNQRMASIEKDVAENRRMIDAN